MTDAAGNPTDATADAIHAINQRIFETSQDLILVLFQPFVTTKDHGMGVGLSLCRAIIEAWRQPLGRAQSGRRLDLPLHRSGLGPITLEPVVPFADRR